jgi:hypothetical protein
VNEVITSMQLSLTSFATNGKGKPRFLFLLSFIQQLHTVYLTKLSESLIQPFQTIPV